MCRRPVARPKVSAWGGAPKVVPSGGGRCTARRALTGRCLPGQLHRCLRRIGNADLEPQASNRPGLPRARSSECTRSVALLRATLSRFGAPSHAPLVVAVRRRRERGCGAHEPFVVYAAPARGGGTRDCTYDRTSGAAFGEAQPMPNNPHAGGCARASVRASVSGASPATRASTRHASRRTRTTPIRVCTVAHQAHDPRIIWQLRFRRCIGVAAPGESDLECTVPGQGRWSQAPVIIGDTAAPVVGSAPDRRSWAILRCRISADLLKIARSSHWGEMHRGRCR